MKGEKKSIKVSAELTEMIKFVDETIKIAIMNVSHILLSQRKTCLLRTDVVGVKTQMNENSVDGNYNVKDKNAMAIIIRRNIVER